MMYKLDLAILVCFALAPVGLLIAMIGFARAMLQRAKGINRTFSWVSASAFLVPVLAVAVLSQILASAVYSNVRNALRGLTATSRVLVNDHKPAEPGRIIAALKTMDNGAFRAHHSHPTTRIRIALDTGDETIQLELGRDSDLPQEYWVFYPEYISTKSNEIARLRSDAFDAY